MPDSTDLVREFHRAVGYDDPPGPRVPTRDLARFRLRLIREEYAEVRDELEQLINAPYNVRYQTQHDVLLRLAKELADLRYVVEGCAAACGLPFLAVYEEVHASNMSKAGPDGLILKREDGKVLKGDHYRPADMESVVGVIIEGTEA